MVYIYRFHIHMYLFHIKIPESVQDLLAGHAMRVHRVIITCEHRSAAPTKPFVVKAACRVDVGCVFGVEIDRVVERIGGYTAVVADGFAEG